MSKDDLGERYLLADTRHTPIARAVLESPPGAKNWQFRVLDGRIDDVMEHEVLRMVGIRGSGQVRTGRILRRREDRIVVEPMQIEENSFREDLRIPVRFESFIYPITGAWTGRRNIVCHDLSCGGIAFYSKQVLEDGEEAEVVIPITEEPLLLRCEVLRSRLSNREDQLYAAKFVDLCDDEDRIVREAVFGVQLRDSGRT